MAKSSLIKDFYHEIQVDGSSLPKRKYLNFQNAIVTDSTSTDTINVSYGPTTISVDSIQFSVTQLNHDLSVLNVVYHNGSEWIKAKSDSDTTLGTHVVISIDGDTFTLCQCGRISIYDHGLVPGEYYYVSDTTAGALTLSEPETGYSNPILYVENGSIVHVLPYRPSTVLSGGSLYNTVYKMSNYSANPRDRILCNTIDNSFNITLPANPVFGDEIQIIDVKGYCNYNPVQVLRNGNLINGKNDNFFLNYAYSNVTFVWTGEVSIGWNVILPYWPTAVFGDGGTFRPVYRTTDYYAETKDKIICDTTSGSFTITLPANPQFGDEIKIVDAVGYFSINPVTLVRNGNKIEKKDENFLLDLDHCQVTLLWTNRSDIGWLVTVT